MHTSSLKSGQAIMEFMGGLVIVMILVLALELVANLVRDDLDTMLEVRSGVATALVAQSGGTAGSANSPYDASNVFRSMAEAISDSGDYEGRLQSFPSSSSLSDGFASLWDGSDPFKDFVGASDATTEEVSSPLLQKAINRTDISIRTEVWMPTWDDLMQ